VGQDVQAHLVDCRAKGAACCLFKFRINNFTTAMMADARRPEITVLYFAAASTAVGSRSERVPLPIAAPGESFPLSALGPLLVARHPETGLDKILESAQWSVDAEMVENVEDVGLKGGEEVAVICPVSGG